MTITALGDSAVVVSLGTGIDDSALPRVRALAEALERVRAPAILDVVPAFSTVAVFYDPVRLGGFAGKPLENVKRFINSCAQGEIVGPQGGNPAAGPAGGGGTAPVVEIPVSYGGDFGPDLEAVAAHAGLSVERAAALHSGADYRVHAIGFVPGFPYLAGLPRELAMPRRASPRAVVPTGSVGIGGAQTGVYPAETPGGWQIIGRTPLVLFSQERSPAALLRTGDSVRFRPISRDEYDRILMEGVRLQKLTSATVVNFCNLTPSVPCLNVIKPGLLTTVQDLGRTGYRSAGVPLGGAMDRPALRAANRLVGNPEDAAGLEITLLGPELEFLGDTTIAVCGAEFEGVPAGKSSLMRSGERLRFGRGIRGCRAYLAVAGGIAVPEVLGSRSTYLRGGFGGYLGRSLRPGDRLDRHEGKGGRGQAAKVDRRNGGQLLQPDPFAVVRAVQGAQGAEFGRALFEAEFKVSPQSDRMGIRLSGPKLERRAGAELVSGAVVPGTVQVPPDGQPIVLMADAQTIGGYPQAAHVSTADLPILAQLKPGDSVRFREISLEEAQSLILA